MADTEVSNLCRFCKLSLCESPKHFELVVGQDDVPFLVCEFCRDRHLILEEDEDESCTDDGIHFARRVVGLTA